MKKIVLSPNPYRDRGLELTTKAQKLLNDAGFETVLSPVFVDVPDGGALVPLKAAAPGAELIISVGGDGTFLHAARSVLGMGIPLLGVNMGSKGFIASLEPEDIGLVVAAAEGKYRPSSRMMLDVELFRADGEVINDVALNDAVIKSDVNCISLEVSADGESIFDFSGDGVIVATPTGSTAYSMSAGGPIVEPEAENIVVTPICAHIMAAKSFVLLPERAVMVRPDRLRGRRTVLSIDGDEGLELKSGDEIRVCRSRHHTVIADMGIRSFYDTTFGKLSHF